MNFPIMKAIVYNRTSLKGKTKCMVIFLETPEGAIEIAKQIRMSTYSSYKKKFNMAWLYISREKNSHYDVLAVEAWVLELLQGKFVQHVTHIEEGFL